MGEAKIVISSLVESRTALIKMIGGGQCFYEGKSNNGEACIVCKTILNGI